MSEPQVELNLGALLFAILNRYEKLEIPLDSITQTLDNNYQLRVDFNDETEMLEITLEESNES